MSDQHAHTTEQAQDSVEAAVPHIPLVLPVVGALVIFMLAFIATHMA